MKSTIKSLLLALSALLLPVSLTGCFESFQSVEAEDRPRLFGEARTVVGKRTVGGIEVPLVVVPYAVGVGGWVTRVRSEGEILAEEEEVLGLRPLAEK